MSSTQSAVCERSVHFNSVRRLRDRETSYALQPRLLRSFPSDALETGPENVGLTNNNNNNVHLSCAHQRVLKFPVRFLFLRVSPPGDVFGFVPSVSVSSSSTPHIVGDASHLLWLLFPPVCLLP